VSDSAGSVFAKFCLLYSGRYLISERPYPNVYTLSDPTTDTVKGKYRVFHNSRPRTNEETRDGIKICNCKENKI
jgi:hypothetical protein